MGFDPRGPRVARGAGRPSAAPQPVTANLDALLAEIEALRRENRQLRQLLERQSSPRPAREGAGQRVTRGAAPSITPQLVSRWIEALERQPGWEGVRLGPPGGLRELLEVLRAQAWNPSLTLEQQLDRRQSGLGAELAAALAGPPSRGRWAVRAAFALYGPSASEWLSDEPRRVVQELLRRLERLESRGTESAHARSTGGEKRRTTAAGSGANHSGGYGSGAGEPGQARQARRSTNPHQAALEQLGLESGASREAIKRAYRRLAKQHHPDLGGDGEAFRALEAAYRLLMG